MSCYLLHESSGPHKALIKLSGGSKFKFKSPWVKNIEEGDWQLARIVTAVDMTNSFSIMSMREHQKGQGRIRRSIKFKHPPENSSSLVRFGACGSDVNLFSLYCTRIGKSLISFPDPGLRRKKALMNWQMMHGLKKFSGSPPLAAPAPNCR